MKQSKLFRVHGAAPLAIAALVVGAGSLGAMGCKGKTTVKDNPDPLRRDPVATVI